MAKPLGIGVVGAGSIGIRGALQHLCLPDVQDRVKLAAVCDPVPGRAKAAAERYGPAGAYENYEDLLADPNVDAVTLCSPIGIHYEQGLQAIEAGKHVHFNKTMTTTTAEATHLIDKAAGKGIKLVASPGQMLNAMNWAIRDLLNDGAIGRLAWAAVGASFGTYHEGEKVRQGDDVLSNINPAWYWRKPGGGPMYDMTVYGIHSLTGVMGAAKKVTGMSGVGIRERTFRDEKYVCDADDNTLLLLDFGDTVFAFVYGTLAGRLTQAGFQVSYFGTSGSIVGREINGKPIDLEKYSDKKPLRVKVGHEHGKLGENHVFQDVMQLARWISEGIPSVATAEHARHVIEIIEAGYRASETGQTQELVTDFEFPIEI